MISALFYHLKLLYTFRHDGTGLPNKFGPTIAVLLFIIVSYLGWGIVGMAISEGIASAVPSVLISAGVLITCYLRGIPFFVGIWLVMVSTQSLIFLISNVLPSESGVGIACGLFSIYSIACIVGYAYKQQNGAAGKI